MDGKRQKAEKQRGEKTRLNQFLSDAGYCSRREADRLIVAGKITVNGHTAVLGEKVSADDVVEKDGRRIQREQEQILLAFHKPVGVECTSDLTNPDNIIDYIGYRKRIYPIGRLDKNSQGLILLTNDGYFVNKILKASNYHEKEYIVTVDKPLTDVFLQRMSSGVRILNQITRPCTVRKTGRYQFHIVLTQGLNRQIRRMCLELGYNVQKLKRIRIMNIELGNLPLGAYRDVTEEELQTLLKHLN